MTVKEMRKMKAYEIEAYLAELMTRLDELDGEDFFGTEGWRHTLMGEDE